MSEEKDTEAATRPTQYLQYGTSKSISKGYRIPSPSISTMKAEAAYHHRPVSYARKLMMSAQTKWRKLDGANRMPEIIDGVEFKDGIKQLQNAA